MAKISGKDTKPEILVRKFLFSHGFRYRKNVAGLPGKPDIVLRKHSVAIFINGCFWHGHENCKKAALPKSNHSFWKAKIERNTERDYLAIKELKHQGWKVITIWQCEIANLISLQKKLNTIVIKLQRNEPCHDSTTTSKRRADTRSIQRSN